MVNIPFKMLLTTLPALCHLESQERVNKPAGNPVPPISPFSCRSSPALHQWSLWCSLIYSATAVTQELMFLQFTRKAEKLVVLWPKGLTRLNAPSAFGGLKAIIAPESVFSWLCKVPRCCPPLRILPIRKPIHINIFILLEQKIKKEDYIPIFLYLECPISLDLMLSWERKGKVPITLQCQKCVTTYHSTASCTLKHPARNAAWAWDSPKPISNRAWNSSPTVCKKNNITYLNNYIFISNKLTLYSTGIGQLYSFPQLMLLMLV